MKIFYTLFFSLITIVTLAQSSGSISGKIIDNANQQIVVGAKVQVFTKGSNKDIIGKSLSAITGEYLISNLPYGTYFISVSMLTFETKTLEITIDKKLTSKDIYLGLNQEFEEINVIGNLVKEGRVPIAVTKVSAQKIAEELGSRDLPMLLNGTPGVYATTQGGGDGDARINVRGFDQRNVGVMIDGVPVNDMENGAVYWSNWFGLDAITAQMQVQRGLGATKIAMPSIGGTINIITQGIGNRKGGSIKQEYGTGNLLRTSFSYNTGMSKNGWGLTFSSSYKQGAGWVYGTPSQGFFGYLKVSKKIDRHLLTLSGFMAPQHHAQRAFNQAIQYWDTVQARNNGAIIDTNALYTDMGIRYNQHWGYQTVNGKQEILSERLNFYNKPQVTLKDFWKVNDKLSISNIAYLSIGRGGGTSIFNSSAILRDSNNLIDWDQMIQENKVNSLFGTPNVDPIYSPTLIKSSQILMSSINNHFWTGYLGQFNYAYSKKLEISGGIDARYYKGSHYQTIANLLGGDYFVSAADKNDANPMQQVGDKIAKNAFNANRDGLVKWAGAFGQAEYASDKWAMFLNVSGIVSGYKGIDYFQKKVLTIGDSVFRIGASDTVQYNGKTYNNSSPELTYFQTAWKYLPGFTIKGGLSYKINKNLTSYVNLGYLNRTPQFSNVIDNNSNSFFTEIINEKILASEGGLNYANKNFGINFNAYATNWQNKPFPYGVAVPDPNDPTEFIRVNINGMDAIHMGGEVDFAYNISKKVTTDMMFSYGNWIWNSTKTVIIPQYDSLKISFDAKGVHVGDAAQTAIAGSIRYEPFKNFYVKMQCQYFDRYYSNFDPFTLQGANGGRESWMMPSYLLINFFTGYKYSFEKSTLIMNASITNILNSVYIADATNNGNGIYNNFDAQSAQVMFGQGFRFNVSLGLQF